MSEIIKGQPGDLVAIGRCEFRVGTWYKSCRHKGAAPRQFLGVCSVSWVRDCPLAIFRWPHIDMDQGCSAKAFRAWAGEEHEP